jgi:hypothetical protein
VGDCYCRFLPPETLNRLCWCSCRHC